MLAKDLEMASWGVFKISLLCSDSSSETPVL